MKKNLFLIFTALISINCFAEKCANPNIQGFDIGNGLGAARAFQLTGCETSISEIDFQIYIERLDSRQDIKITTTMDSTDFDFTFWDFTGDGYTDFLYTVSYGAGPFPSTELWIFNPKENLYVRSSSFPGEGRPFVAKTKGCVFTEVRGGHSPSFQYYRNTWCIDPKTSIWENTSSEKI